MRGSSFIAASILLAMPALAIVPASPDITGRVVDADTKQPIGRALVIASIGGIGSEDRRRVHCSAVRADANGQFVFPAWKWSVGRSMGVFQMPQYGAIVTAYHADYKPDRDAGRVFQAIHQLPLVEMPWKQGGELAISMRRSARDDRKEWQRKLMDAMFAYECDWDADVANTQLFWDALYPEVEEYTRLTGDDPPGGPMYKLKWVTKRPVTEYQKVAPSPPARIEAKVASAPNGPSASGFRTSARIARIQPDPSKGLRVGERVALRVEVDYEVGADSEIVLVVQADTTLLSNTREMLKAGSGRVTLKSDFVVPDSSKVQVYAPLTLRGGRDVPESRTFIVRKAD
jgi:hypothetical protein